MDEDTKKIGPDKRSGPDHFPIFFQNQNLPVLMSLKEASLFPPLKYEVEVIFRVFDNLQNYLSNSLSPAAL